MREKEAASVGKAGKCALAKRTKNRRHENGELIFNRLIVPGKIINSFLRVPLQCFLKKTVRNKSVTEGQPRFHPSFKNLIRIS